MRFSIALLLSVALCFALPAMGQPTLDLSIQATPLGVAGQWTIDIIGVMGGDGHDGLALWACNLEATAGDLDVNIDAMAATGDMTAFDKNDGLTNPAGYGGTPSAGDLLQIGGAQNTIGNTNPPAYPTGTVVTGVGNSLVILASGTYTAPADLTEVTLSISGAMATALVPGGGPDVYEVIPIETITYSVPAVVLFDHYEPPTAVSRMTHGSAGTFDIDMLSGDTECRRPADEVFTFVITYDRTPSLDNPITASSGTVTTSISGNELTVTVTAPNDRECLTLNLIGNVAGAQEDVSIVLLYADQNNDNASNAADIVAAKAASKLEPINASDFRSDVNADGNANAADIVASKAASALGTVTCD